MTEELEEEEEEEEAEYGKVDITFTEAVTRPDAEHWIKAIKAIKAEIQKWKQCQVYMKKIVMFQRTKD